MKYITFDVSESAIPSIIFFTASDTHAGVAHHFAAAGWKPRSAGYWDPLRARTFGESSTMALQPHPDDDRVIKAMVEATLKCSPQQDLEPVHS